MGKPLLKSKTIWFSLLLDIIAVALMAAEPYLHLLEGVLSPTAYLVVLLVISAIVKILRVATFEPVAVKKLLARYRDDLIEEMNELEDDLEDQLEDQSNESDAE